MSSLPAREQRILNEIEQDLASAEPRLAQALVSAKVPMFQYWPVVRSGHPKFRRSLRTAVMLTSLLCGIVLLAVGLACASYPLILIGIPLTQLSPFLVSQRLAKRCRSTRP